MISCAKMQHFHNLAVLIVYSRYRHLFPNLPKTAIFCLIFTRIPNIQELFSIIYNKIIKKSRWTKVSPYLWLRIPELIALCDDYERRSSISRKKSITYQWYFFVFHGYFKVFTFYVYFRVVQSLILITSQNFSLYPKIGLSFFFQKLVSDAQGPKKPFLNIK